ncbi:CDC48 family AAA ATPase, partial [Candidatus Bipolaricaulota bacterium]|nr:CDC48 family AAA ATPase [Candidatus Bipolaricaulota bacterium]
DGLIRNNAGAGIDKQVEVSKWRSTPANSVRLKTTSGVEIDAEDKKFILSFLNNYPVTKDDKVRVEFFGAKSIVFSVVDLSPAEPGLIVSTTSLTVEGNGGEMVSEGPISYEDIGGLGDEIRRVREMVELPLKFPHLFQKLGIEPPKGVLLHGPPGTGKTLLARALANEVNASFFHIGGPEIIGKYYGESEGRLRKVFSDAESEAPSIIFIDEIDAIASKREELSGEKQVERRVVAQLLSLMDGLESRGQVIVIGATNISSTLDPALRRPGRFDREIEIGIPDKDERFEILKIHTRAMPISPQVDLNEIANVTHGYVGADLESLSKESAMAALRRIFPKIDFSAGQIPYDSLSDLTVTEDDFQVALKETGPSALREVFTEVPDVNWDDVGGLDDVKQQLIEAVQWPLEHKDMFEETKTVPPKGVLLYGPPGTGKTLLAKAVANECQANFISTKASQLMSRWVGESENRVAKTFKKARRSSPCVLFIDELDSLTRSRGSGSGNQVNERVVSQLLVELDGTESLHGVVAIGATNRPDIIDKALLRQGRFGLQIKLSTPPVESRKKIFQVHLRGRPLAEDVDVDVLAKKTENLVGADIESICQRASLASIRRAINFGQDLMIFQEDLLDGIEDITESPFS